MEPLVQDVDAVSMWDTVHDTDKHLSVDEFVDKARRGILTDAGGFANLATSTHSTFIDVSPSEVTDGSFPWPSWATHVVWYSK